MDQAISIIIPTYNERDNITPLVERLHKALSAYKHEIVIIDDESKDGTAEVAASLSKNYPVRVIVRKNERGLASAVVHGFRHTDTGVLCVIDADLQHPPEVVPALMKAIEDGADYVLIGHQVTDATNPEEAFHAIEASINPRVG